MDDLDSLPPDDDLPLRGLIDHGATATPRPDALREIVARQERWRVRTLAGVLAAVLLVGPVAGYALAQVGSSTSTAVAARANAAPAANSPNAAPNASAAAVGGSASGAYVTGGGPEEVPATPARQLFIRTTADGVRIRGYLQPFPKNVAVLCGATAHGQPGATSATGANGATPAQPPAASPGSSTNVAPAIAPAPPCPAPSSPPDTCLPTDSLQAQVSNDQVAGAVEAMPFPTTGSNQALTVLDAQIVGAGDPTPIGTVLVKTGTGVASVRLTVTGGGTDSMAPVDGYGIVAANVAGLAPASTTPPTKPPTKAPTKAPTANGTVSFSRELGFGFPKTTVEALDAAGKVLGSVEIPSSVTGSAGPACGPVVAPGGPLTPAPGPSTGSGTVSSGGAGSSGASSGAVSSSGSTSAGSSTAPAGASASSQG